tara:strand:- start:724 stop:876 length:153 start_codon:yes stop_codon:yes gene_type:complete
LALGAAPIFDRPVPEPIAQSTQKAAAVIYDVNLSSIKLKPDNSVDEFASM